jgi:tRNA U34 5-carboxymethylaminomethyl modifying GTPase MnmE/TrmE
VSNTFTGSPTTPFVSHVLMRALTTFAGNSYLEMSEEASTCTDGRMSIMAAEELRRGLAELGRITGRVDLDEILDVVFSDFCIGK